MNFGPYNYVNNNPVNHIDEDGAQWRISFYQDARGQTQILLVYNAAILNSSRNQQLKMKEIIRDQQRLFKEVFGQGNVTAVLNLREISDIKELSNHESLVQVLNPEHFWMHPEKKIREAAGYSHKGGTYVAINAESFQSDDRTFRDRKTLVHEIGHSGGLIHTFELENKDPGKFVNGNPISVDNQGDIVRVMHTNMQISANFMNYTSNAVDYWMDVQNPSEKYKAHWDYYFTVFFNRTVGKASQGQIQQVIANYFNGNLNVNTVPVQLDLNHWSPGLKQ